MDNAGSFDRLIPLLPKEHSYLAIDLPGHGRSSWLPHGVPYHNLDFVHVLYNLMKEYKWEKISLIGHSMGAYVGFLFASIFPDKIDILINIDAVKPVVYSASMLVKSLQESIEKFPIADQNNQEGAEKVYEYSELISRVCTGTFESVNKENAPYLLRRGIIPSKKHPGKFCVTKDARIRYNFGFNLGRSMYLDLAKDIKAPFLVVKSDKVPLFENKEHYDEALQTLKDNNPNFEYKTIDSYSHHPHLTEPDEIAKIISEFIGRHRKAASHL